MNVSQGECCRCFQSVVRMSPTQYLLRYRIHRSMDLQNNSSLSITEVAFACGFNDASCFIQCFKRKTGLTPPSTVEAAIRKNVRIFIFSVPKIMAPEAGI